MILTCNTNDDCSIYLSDFSFRITRMPSFTRWSINNKCRYISMLYEQTKIIYIYIKIIYPYDTFNINISTLSIVTLNICTYILSFCSLPSFT